MIFGNKKNVSIKKRFEPSDLWKVSIVREVRWSKRKIRSRASNDSWSQKSSRKVLSPELKKEKFSETKKNEFDFLTAGQNLVEKENELMNRFQSVDHREKNFLHRFVGKNPKIFFDQIFEAKRKKIVFRIFDEKKRNAKFVRTFAENFRSQINAAESENILCNNQPATNFRFRFDSKRRTNPNFGSKVCRCRSEFRPSSWTNVRCWDRWNAERKVRLNVFTFSFSILL